MPRYHHNPTIHLRPATGADTAAILELETVSFSRAEERFGRRQVQSLTTNPRAIVVVAEDDRKVFGWAAGLLRRHHESNSGRLYAIAVHPNARGRGIGKRFVNHILHWLAMHGARRVFLEVNVKNQEAINLYHKLGFTDQKYLVDYYGPGYHGLRMVREI